MAYHDARWSVLRLTSFFKACLRRTAAFLRVLMYKTKYENNARNPARA